MSLDSEPETRLKLPVWQTAGKAYKAFFENFGSVIRLSWIWLLVFAASTAYAFEHQWELMLSLSNGGVSPVDIALHSIRWRVQTVGILQYFLGIVGGASMAVAWHRFLILDERPATSGMNAASSPVRHYILTGILIVLTVAIPILPIVLALLAITNPFALPMLPAFNDHGPMVPAVALLFAFGWMLWLLGFIRLALLLPARAIGNDALTFSQCWKRTRGNSWRIGFGCFLTVYPPLLPAQLVFAKIMFAGIQPGRMPFAGPPSPIFIATLATLTVYAIFTGLIMIGFLSYAYLHFFGPTASVKSFEERE
jgi:hypothetical protein